MNRVKSDYAGPFGHNGATRQKLIKCCSSTRDQSFEWGVFLVSRSYVRKTSNVTYRFTSEFESLVSLEQAHEKIGLKNIIMSSRLNHISPPHATTTTTTNTVGGRCRAANQCLMILLLTVFSFCQLSSKTWCYTNSIFETEDACHGDVVVSLTNFHLSSFRTHTYYLIGQLN